MIASIIDSLLFLAAMGIHHPARAAADWAEAFLRAHGVDTSTK